jgi:molybdopterin converting factor small subunit
MAVRVRMFAALRETAGAGEAIVDAGLLPDVLAALIARYGEPFERCLERCSVLVDGDPVPRDAPVAVPDGAELALLPPVSGGAAGCHLQDSGGR